MKKQLVRFYAEKLKSVPAYALYLFFEAMERRGWKELTIENAFTKTVNAKNSETEIWFRRPIREYTSKGGGGKYVEMQKQVWACSHANDFSCSSEVVTGEYHPAFPF